MFNVCAGSVYSLLETFGSLDPMQQVGLAVVLSNALYLLLAWPKEFHYELQGLVSLCTHPMLNVFSFLLPPQVRHAHIGISETATILPKGPWLVTVSVGALAASRHWQHYYQRLARSTATNSGGGSYDIVARLMWAVQQCSKLVLLWFGLNRLFSRWEAWTGRYADSMVLGHLGHWAKLSLAVGVVVMNSAVIRHAAPERSIMILALMGLVGGCLLPKYADSTKLTISYLGCVLGVTCPRHFTKIQLASACLVATILCCLAALDGFGGELGFFVLLGFYFASD
jgi:hypothetical protein